MTELISAADARVKTLNAGKEEEQALVAGEINKAATKGFFETFIAKVSDELIETLRGLGYVVNKVKKGVRIAWDYIAPEYKPVTSGAAVNELLAGTDPIVYATFDTSVTINEGEIPTVPAGKELHVLVGHASDVTKVSFSSDGKRIFSASDSDGTAMVWDVESGKVLLKIKEEIRTPNQSVLFSPCGGFVLFCRKSYSAYLKKIEPLQELMDRCRERFKERSLMPEERKMYYLE